MQHYSFLIVGGGMTASAAMRGIREVDSQGMIGLFSAENHPPYRRPLLSKGLWKGKPVEKIWLMGDLPRVDLHLGRTIVAIDPENHLARDDQGESYRYDKLLLATGGTPRRLPFGGEDIIYYRVLDDYLSLRSYTNQNQQFAVIGGGFIGTEIAASLRMVGEEVAIIFPEKWIGTRIFPPDICGFLTDYYRQQGVQVLAEMKITGLETDGGGMALILEPGEPFQADHVIAGIGITPNTGLAESAGLDVENGVVVDEFLRTSQEDVYAAGDVASFFSPELGSRIRVEHEDNALTMGKAAGRNMALADMQHSLEHYHHLPYFYSDLFDVGYEAVGELDSRLEMIVDWQEPFKKGVIYYLRDGRLRGVLLWNMFGQIEKARQLISEPGKFDPSNLRGWLKV